MSNKLTSSDQSAIYQIRLKSPLSSDWTTWFEDLTLTLEEDGDTLLTGPVTDQAELYGLLKKVRDLGIALVSVKQVQPGQACTDQHLPCPFSRCATIPSEIRLIKVSVYQ